VSDLLNDMLTLTQECGGGCLKVNVCFIQGGLPSCMWYDLTWVTTQVQQPNQGPNLVVTAPTPDQSKCPGCAGNPAPSTTPTNLMNDRCEPEIPQGESRVIKKGCIVVGDVFARKPGTTGDPKFMADSRQGTGAVQVLEEDLEIFNLQGASVMGQDAKLDAIVLATKLGGCGTGRGCFDGVYDWKGNRLDKP